MFYQKRFLFCIDLGATPKCIQGLLLTMYSGIMLNSAWGPYAMPGIKLKFDMCEASDSNLYPSVDLASHDCCISSFLCSFDRDMIHIKNKFKI